MATETETVRPNRSVLDYDTEDALRRALMAVDVGDHHELLDTQKPPAQIDWVLPTYDPETTESQSMKQELHRLQVLKSYLILDGAREEAFERITGLAARVFQVPIALVSLVDLGRQWFMSNRGLGDVRETPRKLAFCAHAILSKTNILVVPDASKDFRFQDSVLVTGPPFIRFYAGVPLLSPEGYKLGTFCIIDGKPWPQGLTMDQEATLNDLADMAVEAMVNRRHRLRTQENPAQLIAYTAHDLMTPLTGVQLSLTLLKEDEDVRHKLDSHQGELLMTAATCSDLMIRICESAIESLRKRSADPMIVDELIPNAGTDSVPVTKTDELVKSIHLIMEPIPKQVPLVITLDPAVPPMIFSDDLKLFRSALNLLSSAASRTKVGCIHFRIYPNAENAELVFECEDTGDNIPVEDYPSLYQPSRSDEGPLRLCLSSVASLISALDGVYGFRPRSPKNSSHPHGSIFWFSVPLFAPETRTHAEYTAGKMAHVRRCSKSYAHKEPVIPLMGRTGSFNSVMSADRTRMRLNITVGSDDEAEAVNKSCVGGAIYASVVEDIPDNHRRDAIPEHIVMPAPDRLFVAAAAPHEKRVSSLSTTSNATSRPVVWSGERKRRALVVDDSLVVRKSLAMALKKLHYEVDQAENGLEGLQQMRGSMFDLVLLDFLMPVMDGLDCVKQLRKWEREKRQVFRQVIVGISAHADRNVASQGIEAGMDAFKPKPVGIKTLEELTDSEILRRCSRYLDELDGEKKPAAQPMVQEVEVDPGSAHSSVASRKRDSDNDEDDDGVIPSPSEAKRARTSDDSDKGRLCLIVSDRPTKTSSEVLTQLETRKWKVVIVHDGDDAMRLLQMRNWDAVLIDEVLPSLSGPACMRKFREWETENRVNRQKNTFLVSDADIPSPFDSHSIVQPPSGFDSVLCKPVVWKDLEQLLYRHRQGPKMAIVVRN